MGESINLVAIKSVMTYPQIARESSKKQKQKMRNRTIMWFARALRGVHSKEMKSVVLIWMWNVPHSLRHLNTWSPVGGAVCGGLWGQPCWRTSLGSGLETESLMPCQISLCFPPRVEDVSSPPPSAKSGTCCFASQPICTLIPLQSKSK